MPIQTYRLTHTPLLHHGRRYGPGERVELAHEQAQSLIKAGLIEHMDIQASPFAGESPGHVPKIPSATRKGAKA